MLEPPSESLVRHLLELKLATPRDLRQARGRVRRLARDLPAFDSVWIDALVHTRKLTPFQARWLESKRPEQLAVGPCVLIDELGCSRDAQTYLARRRDGRERCVLKLTRVSAEQLDAANAAVQDLVSLAKPVSPSIVAPHACVALGDRVVTISRHVGGPHLTELLVRRGRFPFQVVVEIGRQLLDGLLALSARGCVHGDIRLTNVRLTDRGVAVLVDAGIAPAVHPELTIHAGFSPEHYEGVAPELIGTGAVPDLASDLYALGCLLWHLLAGRPPFPTADPLARLAAHQTEDIPDVRTWAPDTPAPLAEALRSFTAHDPARRPASPDDLANQWGKPRRAGRRRLVQFRAGFNAGIPHVAGSGERTASRLPLAAAVLLAISVGGGIAVYKPETRHQLLELSSRLPGAAEIAPSEITENAQRDQKSAPRPLPPPSAEGVIELTGEQPFAAGRIAHAGPLVIRGAGAQPAEILVAKQSLAVICEELTLENVRLRVGAGSDVPRSWLRVQCQILTLTDCRIEGPPLNERDSKHRWPPAIAWKLIDRTDPYGGRARLTNVVLFGSGAAVYCAEPPRQVAISNRLKVGPGPLLHAREAPAAGATLAMELERTTLRDSGPLLRWGAVDAPSAGNIEITARDCLFGLATGTALLESIGASTELNVDIEIAGEGSLVGPGAAPAISTDPESGEIRPIDPSRLRLEGIAVGDFSFSGEATPIPADSALKSYQAPRRSPTPPGIDAGVFWSPRSASSQ